MAGPNSAPNGDGRLVVGYSRQDFVWTEIKNEKNPEFPGYWEPMRYNLARKGRLYTGKSD